MNEKMKQIEQMLAEDPALAQKLEESLDSLIKAYPSMDMQEAKRQAIRSATGIDLDTPEAALARTQEIDPEELAHFSGGRGTENDHDHACTYNYACFTAWRHPSPTDKKDACAFNYQCVWALKHPSDEYSPHMTDD